MNSTSFFETCGEHIFPLLAAAGGRRPAGLQDKCYHKHSMIIFMGSYHSDISYNFGYFITNFQNTNYKCFI